MLSTGSTKEDCPEDRKIVDRDIKYQQKQIIASSKVIM